MRSRDYETIKNKFRPGHADYTYFKKYGIRDYRGGGRQSARETAARVAAGAIAKVVLKNKIGKKYQAIGAVTQLGILGCDLKKWKDKTISSNPFFCPDRTVLKLWEKYLLGIRKAGSSCGAIIEVRARGVPLGLGAPIYSKLDMDLAAAMMSVNAVKGVNIGSGMNSAMLTGEENSDEIFKKRSKTSFKSNNAGGILGGISTGQEINVSFAVKPTSSILSSRKTIDRFGKNTTISVKGRHDPCVGIRAVPIGEAMMHCVILDHFLIKKGINISIIDARFAKPLDENLIWQIATEHEVLITIEEGSIGGFGSHVSQYLSEKNLLDSNLKFRSMILPDRFIDHDKPDLMYKIAGLDAQTIENKVFDTLNSKVIIKKTN